MQPRFGTACFLVFIVLFTTLPTRSNANESQQGGVVGGYLLMNNMTELQVLANNAKTLPINRLLISFFSPQMVYLPNSNDLTFTGLNVSRSQDGGFAEIKKYISTLQSGGVEVFLSMGGWNYNCFPYLYCRYSVAGYGSSTPNYWKIDKYGGGNVANCNAGNQYCYVCEPPSEGTTLGSFVIFPEPDHSNTWKQAVQYITGKAGGAAPVWDTTMVPGSSWTDPKTGISTQVPGSNYFVSKNRDPYQDFVYLAKDLGVAGIDLDYEEFWHADYHKTGSGPWNLDQTVYKYAAIAKDIQINIQAIQPKLLLSTAAAAVGAWSGNWWGGNLKGIWLKTLQWYPDVLNFMSTGANAGGINVMTYDLSDNEQYHECPVDGVCALDQQVHYYMNTYQQANIPAYVGYEIGTPAYPDPTHDPTHQLPLTKAMLSSIISQTQTGLKGGFFWEMFKHASGDQASATDVARAICQAVTPGSSRCTGTIPPLN